MSSQVPYFPPPAPRPKRHPKVYICQDCGYQGYEGDFPFYVARYHVGVCYQCLWDRDHDRFLDQFDIHTLGKKYPFNIEQVTFGAPGLFPRTLTRFTAVEMQLTIDFGQNAHKPA